MRFGIDCSYSRKSRRPSYNVNADGIALLAAKQKTGRPLTTSLPSSRTGDASETVDLVGPAGSTSFLPSLFSSGDTDVTNRGEGGFRTPLATYQSQGDENFLGNHAPWYGSSLNQVVWSLPSDSGFWTSLEASDQHELAAEASTPTMEGAGSFANGIGSQENITSQLVTLNESIGRITQRMTSDEHGPLTAVSPELDDVFDKTNSFVNLIRHLGAPSSAQGTLSYLLEFADHSLTFLLLSVHRRLVEAFQAVCISVRRQVDSFRSDPKHGNATSMLSNSRALPANSADYWWMAGRSPHVDNPTPPLDMSSDGQVRATTTSQLIMILQLISHLVEQLDHNLGLPSSTSHDVPASSGGDVNDKSTDSDQSGRINYDLKNTLSRNTIEQHQKLRTEIEDVKRWIGNLDSLGWRRNTA
ncbi:hypothetical protein PG993_000814 [Apiospora rasikravindrae]|uniref:Uncharacterized protein n=1 Tax=Apiospora rasikravindrae TaxID=990691 RepID=A0ABR1U9M4_9PEZI